MDFEHEKKCNNNKISGIYSSSISACWFSIEGNPERSMKYAYGVVPFTKIYISYTEFEFHIKKLIRPSKMKSILRSRPD